MWQSRGVNRENYLANHMTRICGNNKDLDGDNYLANHMTRICGSNKDLDRENDLADRQPHAQDMWQS